ncbi:MAG: substrate-binding domain-containing protein [Proteobacteria bacterium]|nr:substrate-binding domain-containing protein [Pseudomonadota bacterium]
MTETASKVGAEEIRVLSAGAVKRGVGALAEAFGRDTGAIVTVTFATAPVLKRKVEDGTAEADVVIAPVPAMEAFEEKGLVVAGTSAVIGSVKAAVVVRDGAHAPDISTAETFKYAILDADSLVYNRASSGLYIEELMARLGVAEEVAAKTTRLATGAEVMKHLAASEAPKEIGFGQIPEISVYRDQGVTLVGPLPEEIGKTTTYAAGLSATARAPEPAQAFIDSLATPAAKETFRATGVE